MVEDLAWMLWFSYFIMVGFGPQPSNPREQFMLLYLEAPDLSPHSVVDSLNDWPWPQRRLINCSDHHRSLHYRWMKVLLALNISIVPNLQTQEMCLNSRREIIKDSWVAWVETDSSPPPLAGWAVFASGWGWFMKIFLKYRQLSFCRVPICTIGYIPISTENTFIFP